MILVESLMVTMSEAQKPTASIVKTGVLYSTPRGTLKINSVILNLATEAASFDYEWEEDGNKQSDKYGTLKEVLSHFKDAK